MDENDEMFLDNVHEINLFGIKTEEVNESVNILDDNFLNYLKEAPRHLEQNDNNPAFSDENMLEVRRIYTDLNLILEK